MQQGTALHDEAGMETEQVMEKLIGAEQRGEFLIRICPDTGRHIDVATNKVYSSSLDLTEVRGMHNGQPVYRYGRLSDGSMIDTVRGKFEIPITKVTRTLRHR